jgi:formylglycine-generating enzyme required for sulfatase activity
MTAKSIIPAFALVMALFPVLCFANSAPNVSNVTVSQRTDGSKLVDIRYNLSDADGDKCTISVQVSSDGGSTWTVPAVTFTGAIGSNISAGTGKLIIWDCGVDLPGDYGTNYKVKVTADDGYLPPVPGDMVSIPAGTFQMGDSFSEGSSNERPVHTVTLDSFYMGKYDITNSQYRAFLESALSQGLITVTSGVVYKTGSGTSYPYCDTSTSSTYSQIVYSGGVFSVRTKGGRSMVNDPMVQVSWYGSVAYCNWRSQQEGKEQCYNLSTWNCDFAKHGYRLATEAEWEYAARGGLSGKRFPWGDTITHSQANYYSSSSYSYDISPTRGYHPTWSADGIYPYTSPVSSFAANGYGLYDMAGNVWEWCNDWYGSYSSSPQTNPTGPTSGSYRVLRGGGWIYGAYVCRVAYRGSDGPSGRIYISGFRVSLDFQ